MNLEGTQFSPITRRDKSQLLIQSSRHLSVVTQVGITLVLLNGALPDSFLFEKESSWTKVILAL